MSEEKRVLCIDLETFSSVDLKTVGVAKYVESPDFEILLFGYAWDDERPRVLCPRFALDEAEKMEMAEVSRYLDDPSVIKIAHNCAFERACLQKVLGRPLPLEQWEDTMIMAAMQGLPLKLGLLGDALRLPARKDPRGERLINYFCKPCKPTKANGRRTRNLPEHAPQYWRDFISYNHDDVLAEQGIYYRLRGLSVPPFERYLWTLDGQINDRGVLVDRVLVEAAVAVDEEIKKPLLAEMQQLTGLGNPNSLLQLKGWLTGLGIEVGSLDKEAVTGILSETNDTTIRRVLTLRQLLGKSSTAKYAAMLDGICNNGRIHGLLQYYGAGRTGRWAGRKVQLQNLPQNHIDHIGTVRELVRCRDTDTLGLLFDSIPDVLSQLIRTALIAPDGCTLLVADFSAIEARVIAYLAGEQWLQAAFAAGKDIYCASASQMFGVPVVKHGVNGHLRQKGKVAELACIAEGQLVLTNLGLVPIEKISQHHLLWDGVEWVSHNGVVCRGSKEVISYGGLEATADHIVWAEINGAPRKIQFGAAAASGAHLIQTGAGRLPIQPDRNKRPPRDGDGDRPDKCKWKLRAGQSSVGNSLRKLPKSTMVYDIINAGPRNRFTVSGVLAHNCGYGGGVRALRRFGADKMGLSDDEMQRIVDQWRAASPTIPAFWREAEKAAKAALRCPGREFTLRCGVGYRKDADALRCRLPSGRLLSYWGAGLDDEGKIVFMGMQSTEDGKTSQKWSKQSTWGGKLVENIVQAFARDCLAVAMLRLNKAGYKILFHVHDEVICEAREGASWEPMAEIMGRPIPWAPGLLLRAGGYETKFYMKD